MTNEEKLQTIGGIGTKLDGIEASLKALMGTRPRIVESDEDIKYYQNIYAAMGPGLKYIREHLELAAECVKGERNHAENH